MAANKNSFILYCDLIHTVRKMPKDKAGELFMTILSYVNDEDPSIEDTLIDLVFEPIKQQLKRDLKDWEEKRKVRSETGRLGGIKSGNNRRKQNEATLQNRSKPSKYEANEAVNVSVSDNVNVTVSVNDMNIPPLEEFLAFARGVTGSDYELLQKSIELKYRAWIENDWKTGKDKKIKNWKSTLLNTIQYLEKEKSSDKKESKALQTISNYQRTQQILNERRNSNIQQ